MSYTPLTDFLALLRQTSGGERLASVPGLDYVVSALSRAGLFQLLVGQTAPTVNQATTVWLQPSVPSWVTEGIVFLWDAAAQVYVKATPALWDAFFTGSTGYVFQSVAGASGIVGVTTSILAVQRVAPVTTSLTLPTLVSHGTKPLHVVDWSTGVTGHTINLIPSGGTIMQQASWQLRSTSVQLSSVTLYPSLDLNGWIIAP